MTRPLLPLPLAIHVGELIAAHLGLNFPQEKQPDLERGLASAASAFAAADAEGCARNLLSLGLNQHRIKALAPHLTVGETYFFRDQEVFDALERRVFPALIQARARTTRQLRIWSTGCATGEEAYSIALLLDRLIPRPEDWDVRILATDINPVSLQKAEAGVYGAWSFRNTPRWCLAAYFRPLAEGRYELRPEFRKRVRFRYLNLVENSYPPAPGLTSSMDVILCRNVLMYFTRSAARDTAARLYRSLAEDGWLIVSPVENACLRQAGFEPEEHEGILLHRRLPEPQATWPPPGLDASRPSAAMPSASPATPPAARREPSPAPSDDAVARCLHSIEADKLNPAHHYQLAAIRQERGELDDAALSLLRVLFLAPDFVPAHVALGKLRLSQGRHAEADRHFLRAQALLSAHLPEEPVAGSAGMTASWLRGLIEAMRRHLAATAGAQGAGA